MSWLSAGELWRERGILSLWVEQETLNQALRVGCKRAERSRWRGHIWKQKENNVCVVVVNFSSSAPTLARSPGNTVQIQYTGQENLHSKWERLSPTCRLLPQRQVRKYTSIASESRREQACPQRAPSVHYSLSVNLNNICRAVSERLQFFPRGLGVRFRACCHH